MIAIPNMKMLKSCNECMSECINIPLECYPDGDTVPDCPLIDIVTCGECKYYKIEEDEYFGVNRVCKYVIGGTVCRYPNDFCSRGERRSE